MCVLDGYPIKAIIDTGSEMNIIGSSMMNKISPDAPVHYNPGVEMCDANNGTSAMVGVIEGIDISVASMPTFAKGLYIKHRAPFQLLLGRPWQQENKVSIDERADGTYLIFKDPDYTPISEYKIRNLKPDRDERAEGVPLVLRSNMLRFSPPEPEEDTYSPAEYWNETSDKDRRVAEAIAFEEEQYRQEERAREAQDAHYIELAEMQAEEERLMNLATTSRYGLHPPADPAYYNSDAKDSDSEEDLRAWKPVSAQTGS